ncbi:MAG: S-adenosylmethionine:tRNA ribosyltransferase-isomerase [Bacteroidota bacterium]
MDNQKQNLESVDAKAYHYDLPEEKIAKFPSKERGGSRLLVLKNQEIQHRRFTEITDILPTQSLLVFNNTRVIPARMLFHKSTGAQIEIFLLEPIAPSRIMSEAMSSTGNTTWKCMIGNAKKWKSGQVLQKELAIDDNTVIVSAYLEDRVAQQVRFEWTNKTYSFAEVIDALGKVPLPPYIDRALNETDQERYQTVYSKVEGAVAAPTAGLHFTQDILDQLPHRQIEIDEVTLHVSAGTFQPMKTDKPEDHPMHSEQVIITTENLKKIIAAENVIAVGTTSMRTLESTYWYGVQLMAGTGKRFFVKKLYPYEEHTSLPDRRTAFQAVMDHMKALGTETLVGETEIFIFPGYQFRVCDGLVTNFHLPGSTLILLIAAFIGEKWREVYNDALAHDYRFLSYGDSSLLLNCQ